MEFIDVIDEVEMDYSNLSNIVVSVTGDGSGLIAVANVTNKPEKSNNN
jgi:hypothetical protein